MVGGVVGFPAGRSARRVAGGFRPVSKTRVLFCVDSVGDEAGTERHVADVASRLDRSRFELHLCCLADSPRLRELSTACACRLFPVGRVYSPSGLSQIVRLHRYINAQAIDIVHTYRPKATSVGVLAALGSRARAVVASRRNIGYWQTPRSLRLFRFLTRHTTRVLANSEAVKRWIVETERLPPDRVDVIYNGVDMEAFRGDRADPRAAEALGIPPAATVVGMVANYRPVKDPHLFLQAARLVAAEVPSAVFLLVGKGPLGDELARLAADLGLGDRVSFTDGRGRVVDYLARMSVGCLSSRSEGFSNAILEYMAAGLPVVATDVGGNAEAVEDGGNGYLIRSRDPRDFAAAVIRLVQEESLRRTMGARSIEICRQKFDIGVAVGRQQDYYCKVLEPAA